MTDSAMVVETIRQVGSSPVGWGGALFGLAAAVRIVWPILDKIGPTLSSILGKSKSDGKFMTFEDHEKICSPKQALSQSQFAELEKNREEVWKKIDQIYEWMVTGIVQINRRM
jgi:hypothetical protein